MVSFGNEKETRLGRLGQSGEPRDAQGGGRPIARFVHCRKGREMRFSICVTEDFFFLRSAGKHLVKDRRRNVRNAISAK